MFSMYGDAFFCYAFWQIHLEILAMEEDMTLLPNYIGKSR